MDFLSSLAEYCSKESNLCTPTFVAPEEAEPHISAVESYYPCATAGQTFIPNSIVIGRAKEDNGQAQKGKKEPIFQFSTHTNLFLFAINVSSSIGLHQRSHSFFPTIYILGP